MRTESQEYEAHLAELIESISTKIAVLDNQGRLSASDEIEVTALEALLERLQNLEGY